MADLSGVMNFGVSMLAILPQILFLVQIFLHLSFLMFFGWIVMLGYRTYSSGWFRFLLRLAFGFVALICGISISNFMGTGMFGEFAIFLRIVQFDVLLGGLIASLVLLVAVFLISRYAFNVEGIRKAIEKLDKRLKKAEESERKAGKEILRKPSVIIGIVLFLGLLVFSLISFPGYPSFSERVFSEMGISSEELKELVESAQQSQNISGNGEGCVNVLNLLQENSDALTRGELPVYANIETKNLIESETGARVLQMYSVKSGGKDFVLAMLDNEKVCSATEKALCSCLNYGSMI